MSDRDTLADLIENALYGPETVEHATNAARIVLAAGWRPPAREITALDELLDLPVGTIVRSRAGTIACRFDLRRGVVFGDDRPFEWARLALPATVIPVPTEEADRG